MNFDEIQRRARALFVQEAAELLTELEAALLALERNPADLDAINRVFRAMHTLKGSGATSGFGELADFVHHVEDVYNAAREGRRTLDSSAIDHTLRIVDAISRYFASAPAEAAAVLAAAQPILLALRADHAPDPVRPTPVAAADAAPSGWQIRFQPAPHFFRSGSDPALFLDDLRTLGPCAVRAPTDTLPPFASLDPECSYLAWDITLTAPVTEAAVREVFAFVADECQLDLTPLRSDASAASSPTETAAPGRWLCAFTITDDMLTAPGLLTGFWQDFGRLGAHHVRSAPAGATTERPLAGPWQVELTTAEPLDAIRDAFAFLMQADPKITACPLASPSPSAPLSPPAPQPTAAPMQPPEETLRVSSRKLDHLVNLVGELVILRSQLHDVCQLLPTAPAALQAVNEGLQRLTAELREVVLEVRMMPLGDCFNKFHRLARDLSRELGKEVDLVVSGAATEMDKTMLDQLNDPLVHLMRNCLDHGLEPTAERLATGKPARGTLRLAAEQQGDRVCITVADDGRGLDPAKIRAKAVARGLLAPQATMSEADLFQLIFLPGFSTAETVSKVSGRGVGLDVVKRRLELLRGTVELASQPGRGTTIRLALPLTLAIIEGLMVRVGGERYLLPLSAARETIEITPAQRTNVVRRQGLPLRGELIPHLRLREIFGCGGETPEIERMVVFELEGRRFGLVVDEVLGNHQTVLKTLGWLSHRVPTFAGATVLGNGHLALVLDLAQMLRFFDERGQAVIC